MPPRAVAEVDPHRSSRVEAIDVGLDPTDGFEHLPNNPHGSFQQH